MAICEENNFGLEVIYFLARLTTKLMKGVHYVVSVLSISSCNEGEVISKVKMGDFGSYLSNFDREPTPNLHMTFYGFGESLYTHNEDIWRHRVSMSDAPIRSKVLSPTPIDKY